MPEKIRWIKRKQKKHEGKEKRRVRDQPLRNQKRISLANGRIINRCSM
jgi:hypothetical protein